MSKTFVEEHGPELERIERESLRRQYQLLHEIRDRMLREPADWYDEWSDALMPLTNKIIVRLRELEGAPPPRTWWDEANERLDSERPEQGGRRG